MKLSECRPFVTMYNDFLKNMRDYVLPLIILVNIRLRIAFQSKQKSCRVLSKGFFSDRAEASTLFSVFGEGIKPYYLLCAIAHGSDTDTWLSGLRRNSRPTAQRPLQTRPKVSQHIASSEFTVEARPIRPGSLSQHLLSSCPKP